MKQFKIFCTSLNYYKIIDTLPNNIIPLGLGEKSFPPHWHHEKQGKNISHLNTHYGELTGLYWIWKNTIKEMKKDDLIGNCHYRKLWLNNLYQKKQKFSISSLYRNLLKQTNYIENFDSIQVQPILFKNINLFDDFEKIHRTGVLKDLVNFLDEKNKILFSKHLNENILFPLNMFITRVEIFEKFCEQIFPWLDKCLNIYEKKKMLNGYNTRLPAFLAERFTSFWFSQFTNRSILSYARLGKVFLSNKVNKIFNPIKLPLTFRMYPTLHKY